MKAAPPPRRTFSLCHARITRTIGHGSAVVYRLRAENAWSASGPESLYFPAGSVRILVQLLIAATSPVLRRGQKVSMAGREESGRDRKEAVNGDRGW